MSGAASRRKGGFLFVLPSLVILGGFGILVSFSNIWFSLLDWTALSAPHFVLFSNYAHFFRDHVAIRSLLNTFEYAALYVVPTLVISLLVAVLLNRHTKVMLFYRTLFYIPVVTSYVIVIVVWQWFYDYNIGLFNQALALVGVAKVPWLLSPSLALPSLVLLSIWKNSGYTILIFLAGLQTIDANLYDAAKIDGCGTYRLFFRITLPQLRPTTLLSIVMVTTWSFQMFVQPYLLTQGGPNYSTSTIAYYLYVEAFSFYNVGYGSTIAVIGVAVFFIVITIERRLFMVRG